MVKTCWDAFSVLLAWEVFGQRMLICILCPSWHGRGLINTCYDTFSVLAGVGGVCSTRVEMHFISLLAWEGFVKHM